MNTEEDIRDEFRVTMVDLKGVAQRKRCVEANGPVKGATMGFNNF